MKPQLKIDTWEKHFYIGLIESIVVKDCCSALKGRGSLELAISMVQFIPNLLK